MAKLVSVLLRVFLAGLLACAAPNVLLFVQREAYYFRRAWLHAWAAHSLTEAAPYTGYVGERLLIGTFILFFLVVIGGVLWMLTHHELLSLIAEPPPSRLYGIPRPPPPRPNFKPRPAAQTITDDSSPAAPT